MERARPSSRPDAVMTAGMAGWPICSPGGTPISRPWRWPTRMSEPYGRCWRMVETLGPTTGQYGLPCSRTDYQPQPYATGNHTTDCSGDHAVMASQVRPGLAQPKTSAALRVRKSDWESTRRSHQGQRHRPQQKSGCTGAIYPCKPSKLKAWQGWARPCTDDRFVHGCQRMAEAK